MPVSAGHKTTNKQLAFDLLKETLVSSNVMAHPKTYQPYLLYCVASDYAVALSYATWTTWA